MKLYTLYLAEKRCRSVMENCLEIRGARQGIAVLDDKYAVRWQRYDRLAQKLCNRITKAMTGERAWRYHPEPYCWYCGYPTDVCTSRCKRKIRETAGSPRRPDGLELIP